MGGPGGLSPLGKKNKKRAPLTRARAQYYQIHCISKFTKAVWKNCAMLDHSVRPPLSFWGWTPLLRFYLLTSEDLKILTFYKIFTAWVSDLKTLVFYEIFTVWITYLGPSLFTRISRYGLQIWKPSLFTRFSRYELHIWDPHFLRDFHGMGYLVNSKNIMWGSPPKTNLTKVWQRR